MSYKVYGSTSPGDHPSETMEMATFFSQLPPHLKCIALHIRNEGKMSHAQYAKVKAAGGYVKGASDIVIPGAPSFVCELKSLSKKARVSKEQVKYLNDAAANGAFSCLCYGWEAAMEAVQAWEAQ